METTKIISGLLRRLNEIRPPLHLAASRATDVRRLDFLRYLESFNLLCRLFVTLAQLLLGSSSVPLNFFHLSWFLTLATGNENHDAHFSVKASAFEMSRFLNLVKHSHRVVDYISLR